MGELVMEFEASKMYKLGTYWVFDLNTKVGYKVEKKKDKVTNFEEAFRILGDGVDKSQVSKIEVPLGVIKKAYKLMEMDENGELATKTDR